MSTFFSKGKLFPILSKIGLVTLGLVSKSCLLSIWLVY
jgi:hypothetical protein